MNSPRAPELHTDTLELLEELARLPGVSGYEDPVRRRLQRAWTPVVDRLEVSPLGNLVAHRHSASSPAATVLLTAHMDSIGLIVSDIVGGFLRFEGLGRVDPRSLAGQRVTVLTDDPLPGYIVARPKGLLPEEAKGGEVELEHLLIDLAMEADEVADRVQIGDVVSLSQALNHFGDERVFGRALDNRLSLVALTEALIDLDGEDLAVDLIVAATVQEETNRAGGFTLGQQYQPDAAVIVDTTFGRAPGLSKRESFPLGEGLAVGRGPSLHPRLRKWIEGVADSSEISWRPEILPGLSGTEADWIQLSGRGIMCGLVSIPILNMHTAVEVGSLNDAKACAELLAALARAASMDLVADLKWD